MCGCSTGATAPSPGSRTQLLNRGLTRPVFYGNFIVVGDYEGYLHWINMDDGLVCCT